MQVEIVRHHRGAEDANGEIEHVRIADDLGRGEIAAQQRADLGRRERDFEREAGQDKQDHGDDEGLEPAHPAVL
ncbi:hypothetical protein D3C83_162630 [compost metagenome]